MLKNFLNFVGFSACGLKGVEDTKSTLANFVLAGKLSAFTPVV